MDAPKPLGTLPLETDAETRAAASVGEADIAELKARARRLTRTGGVLQKDGLIVQTEAKLTQRLLLGDGG